MKLSRVYIFLTVQGAQEQGTLEHCLRTHPRSCSLSFLLWLLLLAVAVAVAVVVVVVVVGGGGGGVGGVVVVVVIAVVPDIPGQTPDKPQIADVPLDNT